MTLEQFEKTIFAKEILCEIGFGSRMAFTMDRPKRYRPGKRKIRTAFGIVECYPSADDGKILIWMTLKQAKAYLKREKEKEKCRTKMKSIS